MGGDPLDFSEISFFELDKLFTQSAKALRRKEQRRRRRAKKNAGDGSDSSRSRSPNRPERPKAPLPGGFTNPIGIVEKTVSVTGVPTNAEEKQIFQHFCRCGTIKDIRVIRNRKDQITGTVLIEFVEDEAVVRACTLPPPHNEIMGVPCTAKRCDAQLKKIEPAPKRMMTRQQFTQQVLSGLKTTPAIGDVSGPAARKLHIKNLRPVVTEEDMRGIFKPFGDFEAFQMGTGECWITFQNHNDAQDAMTSMQGFLLVGQELQITTQAVPVAAPSAPAPPPPTPSTSINLGSDSDFGATGAVGSNPLSNRIELMKKLMSSHSDKGVPTVVGLGVGENAAKPAPSSTPSASQMPPTPKPGSPTSRTLLLQNMFSASNVNLAKEPRFYEEIREDTSDECAKFGKVLHVTVDPRGASGLIYVLYETPQQRMAAELALNGRWFEGKKIMAMGIDDSMWQVLADQAQGKAA